MAELDRDAHKRYLDYRERHEYFGATVPILTRDAFIPLDVEHLALEAKGESGRDDEEEARFEKLSEILFRD